MTTTEITFGVARTLGTISKLVCFQFYEYSKDWLLQRFSLNVIYGRTLWARNCRLDTCNILFVCTNTIILRYENLNKDFEQIQKLLIVTTHFTSPQTMTIKNYILVKRRLVWDVYLKDIVEYGYAY